MWIFQVSDKHWHILYIFLPVSAIVPKKLFVFRSAMVLIGHIPDKVPGTHKAMNMSMHISIGEILAINFFEVEKKGLQPFQQMSLF